MPSRIKLHNHNHKHKSCRKSCRKSRCRKQHNKKSKKHHTSKKRLNYKKNKRTQRGGFNNCALATVKESGFNIPAIGDVPGFSLSDSNGAINRPNCKTDSYQAMTPA